MTRHVLTLALVLSASAAFAKPVATGSAIKFDAEHPAVHAFAKQKGWIGPSSKVSVTKGQLVYTTDHWASTHTAPLQYLYDNRQGFLLPDVPHGTPIEYAVHATIGQSRDGFRSYSAIEETWVNNDGKNYTAKTTPESGY